MEHLSQRNIELILQKIENGEHVSEETMQLLYETLRIQKNQKESAEFNFGLFTLRFKGSVVTTTTGIAATVALGGYTLYKILNNEAIMNAISRSIASASNQVVKDFQVGSLVAEVFTKNFEASINLLDSIASENMLENLQKNVTNAFSEPYRIKFDSIKVLHSEILLTDKTFAKLKNDLELELVEKYSGIKEDDLPNFKPTDLFTSQKKPKQNKHGNADGFIAEGGFGKVLLCIDRSNNKYAVKVFSILGTTEEIKEKLKHVKKEAIVLRKVEHPSILEMYGVTEWGNCLGIVTEYLPGKNLDGFLKNSKLIDIPWCLRLRIAKQISEALSFLHNYKPQRHLIHGDLKPENILMDKDLSVKVADFGAVNMAISIDAKDPSFDVPTNYQHTLLYVAPEFLKDINQPRKPEMDVFSFGMILYEVITRMRVFENATKNMNVIQFVITAMQQRPDIRQLTPIEGCLCPKDLEIFQALKQQMEICWKQKPEQRPKMISVNEFFHGHLQNINKETMEHEVRKVIDALNVEEVKVDIDNAVPLNQVPLTQTNLNEDTKEQLQKEIKSRSADTIDSGKGDFTENQRKRANSLHEENMEGVIFQSNLQTKCHLVFDDNIRQNDFTSFSNMEDSTSSTQDTLHAIFGEIEQIKLLLKNNHIQEVVTKCKSLMSYPTSTFGSDTKKIELKIANILPDLLCKCHEMGKEMMVWTGNM